jgi:hypothetical protein
MKSKFLIISSLLTLVVITTVYCSSNSGNQTGKDPWTSAQLIEPSTLAAMLAKPGKHPVIINIGPAGSIPEAIEIDAVKEPENMKRFEELIKTLDKNTETIIYCGCCPFKNCPNIRPAFSALVNAGFKKPELLNLKENLKVDWISKGYPMK